MTENIKIAAVDYLSASVEEREKFSFTESGRRALLRKIAPRVREAVLISTCNRTELAVISDEEPAELLRDACGTGNGVFTVTGEAAVERIFEIAAGLHSQIPLEDQILGQMKDAISVSLEEKTSGAVLDQLFQRAVTAGKEIRRKYKELPHECSAASAACSAAESFFRAENGSESPLRGISALIIGSGKMGMLAAGILNDAGAKVRMTMRRHRKDRAVAPDGVETISYDARYEALSESSLVICATASPHCVLTSAAFPDDGKKRLMIDLAVPRDIESSFAERPSVTLVDMDGLGKTALPEGFEEEIKKSVSEHIKGFLEWEEIHKCVPYIEAICAFVERETRKELEFAGEDDEQISIMKYISAKAVRKLLISLKNTVDINTAKECYRLLAKAVER